MVSNGTENGDRQANKNMKKVLHFCDGTLEQNDSYPSDEDETDQSNRHVVNVDPSSLNWTDWMKYKAGNVGNAALETCDYVGEGLANFFGITTPKYQFEIDHYNTMKAMESDELRDIEMGNHSKRQTITEEPKISADYSIKEH